MTGATDLGLLARQMGIEESYWDIFGTFHETSAESQRALLSAMGCDVSSDDAIRHELHTAENACWQRRLPPVCVIRGSDVPASVKLSMPARLMTRQARWRIVLENGEQLGADFLPSELDREDAREIDNAEIVRLRLCFPDPLPEGYHRLYLDDGEGEESCGMIAAPRTAYRPSWMNEDRRQWGWACHLYGLRSERNWGIGDFTDLADLAASSHGASVLGINPLHSLFVERPEEASPYSPSSRIFLNPLYIDVTAVPEFATSEAARSLAASPAIMADLATARTATHVDYPRVTGVKISVLEALHSHFATIHPPSASPDPRRRAFNLFLEVGGSALQRYALFEALQGHFSGAPWATWPTGYRTPDSSEIAAFARDRAARIEFFSYIQWQADEQLGAAATCCANAGMAVGLYRDLAVGANPDGADVWSDQDVYAHGARVGAPPDSFNTAGQDWGLPPLHPASLRSAEYNPFIRMVRANMRHAGALRIDHAMAMRHLFWLVPGQETAAGAPLGAYVSYHYDDLLGILALESKRNRCIVIGEDLGTVPDGFRQRMDLEAILSYRVLFFERHPDGLFRRPETYPARSVAIAQTHDMPTVCGYWRGEDLWQRRDIGLIADDEAYRKDVADRDHDKALLLAALGDQNLLTDFGDGDEAKLDPRRLVEVVERYLARTPSKIMLANIDDATLESEQLNMPGTVFEYPNWRRKLSMPLERFSTDSFVAALAEAIAAERECPTPESA